MLVNHDVTDMMEEIPVEKFKILGLDKDAEAPSRPRIGYWQDAWRRLRQNKVAVVALVILLVLVFFILFGPMISGYDFAKMDQSAINQDRAQSIYSEPMTSEETYSPEYGRAAAYLS